MTNTQYNNTLTIFFISYSVFEPLTNILLKRLRPSVFIPIIMILWVSWFPYYLYTPDLTASRASA